MTAITKGVFLSVLVWFDDLGAENITKSIVSHVQKALTLSLNDCLTSTFDSASTMSGSISGVQVRLKDHNPRILYTYCFNHVLNLCSVGKIKSVDNASFFFEIHRA